METSFGFYVLYIVITFCVNSVLSAAPSFDRLTENITVVIGTSANLPCFISNLGDHKVNYSK